MSSSINNLQQFLIRQIVVCTDFKCLLFRFQEILALRFFSFSRHDLTSFFLIWFGQCLHGNLLFIYFFKCESFPFVLSCLLSKLDNWGKYTVLVHFSMIIESKVAVKLVSQNTHQHIVNNDCLVTGLLINSLLLSTGMQRLEEKGQKIRCSASQHVLNHLKMESRYNFNK